MSSFCNESISNVENIKLNTALTNAQIQKERIHKEIDNDNPSIENNTSSQSHDTSAGEDSGITARVSSNEQVKEKYSHWSDKKGLVKVWFVKGFCCFFVMP